MELLPCIRCRSLCIFSTVGCISQILFSLSLSLFSFLPSLLSSSLSSFCLSLCLHSIFSIDSSNLSLILCISDAIKQIHQSSSDIRHIELIENRPLTDQVKIIVIGKRSIIFIDFRCVRLNAEPLIQISDCTNDSTITAIRSQHRCIADSIGDIKTDQIGIHEISRTNILIFHRADNITILVSNDIFGAITINDSTIAIIDISSKIVMVKAHKMSSRFIGDSTLSRN